MTPRLPADWLLWLTIAVAVVVFAGCASGGAR